jgi:predicted patatin/cPLA2 family phospholipase
MENVGLVLEGGGMRGLYTCGALEFFMEKDIYFNYIIGVSAGACNAVSYIARQKGRNSKVNIQFSKDWRYMSFRNLLFKKSFFGMDFIFEEIPSKYVPFDFETFYKSDCRFLVGTTDCNTGKSVYLNKEDLTEGFYALRATSALPLISPIINFKGYELLDGGISDSIPITKSIEDGNAKNIIILTRNKEYRKSPIKHISLLKLKYKKYPSLIKTMTDRYKNYNKTLEYVEQLESEGKVIVIRPSEELKVGRLERDPKKLQELFENGYEDAKNNYEKIMEFLSN